MIGEDCMALRRGDVALVPFPFSDLSTTKVRPAVVISSELYHSTEPDLILAAITSRISAVSDPLDYILQDWQSAGLRYPSAFKPPEPESCDCVRDHRFPVLRRCRAEHT